MLVNPPRERPSVSRLGVAAGFLSFDPAPCVHHRGRHDLRVDISWRRMAGTGGVLMRPDHRGINPDRPLRALVRISATTEFVQNPDPRSIA